MKLGSITVLALLSCFVAVGCKPKEDVIAKIGGEKITVENFKERLEELRLKLEEYVR